MIELTRFFALFILMIAAVPFTGWQVLICADFLSLDDCLNPGSGWTAFALITALSIVLPPVLHAWPDHTRPLSDVVRETARSMLLTLALFAVFFLAGAKPLFRWLGLPDIMMSMAALFLAPLIACPVQYLSYKAAVTLLPRPGPTGSRPRSVQIFSVLSLLFLFILIFHVFLLPGESFPVIHAGRQNLLSAAWRFFALRYVIVSRGNAGFAPAWGGCCLVSLLEVVRALPDAGGAELMIMAVLSLLMVASTVCLLLPSARRWLC